MTNYLNFGKSGILLAVLAVTGMFSACRKTFQEDKPKPVSTISGQVPTTITVEEMYARLPQTIMYNLADQVTLHLDKAQWRHEEEYLMARIPLNEEENRSYLYAVKPYNAPTGPVRAYLVQFFHNPGSTRDDFSGRQMWLNLQDYSIYGVEYAHNTPTRFMDPIPINPYWESELYDAGLFYLDASNKIAVYNNPQNPDTSTTLLPWNSKHPGGRGKDLKCPDEGSHFFQNLLAGIGGVLLSINEFLNNGEGGASPPWNQDGGEGGFYGGSDGFEPPQPPGGNNNWTPPPPPPIKIWDNATTSDNNWSELGENPSTPIPIYVNGTILSNAVAGGTSVMTITNPTVTYLMGVLGLNSSQASWLQQNMNKANSIMTFLVTYTPDLTASEKKDIARDHLKMMIENNEYLERINDLTGNWWELDQNQMVIARKIHLELYLQSNPSGMLDCDILNQLPMNMYQEVGSYQVPQSVLNRIINIRYENSPAYNLNNFRIQHIQDALGGVVNCDYFRAHISLLPTNSIGNTMTPAEFLEYFRQTMNDYSMPNAQFLPYFHYSSGNYDVQDAEKWGSPYGASLGALVHIEIPLISNVSGLVDNGTVIESGYYTNSSANQHSFTFTTMESPLDAEHPVAGNRRFGIFPHPSGGYVFYTMGVDRTNDISTTLTNWVLGSAFSGADNLWNTVFSNLATYVNQTGGIATIQSPVIARPNWTGPVKQFLLGKKSLAQMKIDLHCP